MPFRNSCQTHAAFYPHRANRGCGLVKSLPKYAKALNEEPSEELSWKSAFEVYCGRKVNHVDRLSKLHVANEWDQTGKVYGRMVSPKPSDYTRHTEDLKKIPGTEEPGGRGGLSPPNPPPPTHTHTHTHTQFLRGYRMTFYVLV